MDLSTKTERIWEIDFLRGFLIPGMILIHLLYDVVELYGFVDWEYPAWYFHFRNNYGALFVMLSGISVTLGSHCIRRGLTVFAGGMICTVVTVCMYYLGMANRGIIIYFGVLHCIGVCMMLWPAFRRWPVWILAGLGTILAAVGLYLRFQVFDFPWLVVLGFSFQGFSSSDYFPLMPNLGYFLIGGALGKAFYRQKRTLLPRVNPECIPIRMLTFCGRHSLLIYLLHQPVLALMCEGIALFRKL